MAGWRCVRPTEVTSCSPYGFHLLTGQPTRQALVPVRKIIRTGEIMLLVDSLVQARQAIETAAEATGGYVASAQANQSGDPGSVSDARGSER